MSASPGAAAHDFEDIANGLRDRPVARRPQLPHATAAAALYEERGRRARMFRRFGLTQAELGWDMLLLLYMAMAEGRPVSVSAICGAGGTSPTTGLRHLALLVEHGVVARHGDPDDRRRSWVRFTEAGLTAMRLHLEEIDHRGANEIWV